MITNRQVLSIIKEIDKVFISELVMEKINDCVENNNNKTYSIQSLLIVLKRLVSNEVVNKVKNICNKKSKNKMTAIDIEEALYRRFSMKEYIAVPNVYWGLGINYEIDMFICNKKSKICSEIEIKISKSDLKADKKKKHQHSDPRVSKLWFAVPKHLEEYALKNIPENAGLFVIEYINDPLLTSITEVKKPIRRKDYVKLDEKSYLKLLELGVMRLQKKTKRIIELNRNRKQL